MPKDIKGFYPEWRPQKASRKYLDEILDVMMASRDEWPLTQRYWLYRLMAKHGWIKLDEYGGATKGISDADKKLCTRNKTLNLLLSNGRRAGIIPWEAVESKRGSNIAPYSMADASALADDVEYDITNVQFSRQAGQAKRVVLWCETEPVAEKVSGTAHYYGAIVLAGKGFDTIGSKYNFAKDIATLGDVLILHLGDLDKSGHTVHVALMEDIAAFTKDMGGNMEMRRIGLTEAQAHAYADATAVTPTPPGLNKGNHGEGFDSNVECQLEALDFPVIRQAIVAPAFEEALDMDVFNERLLHERVEREHALAILKERLK